MSDDASENSLESSIGGSERELESALRSLAPAGDVTIDPISAAFEAGQRSRSRTINLWRGTSAIAAIVAAVVWFAPPAHRSAIDRSATIARVDLPPAPLSSQSILRLRDAVLDRGFNALPATIGGASGRVVGVRDML